MVIKKFGGTSVKNSDAIKRVAKIIENEKQNSIVVVSAFATVTNNLVNIINYLKEGDVESALSIADDIKVHHLETAQELGVLDKLLIEIESSIKELKNFLKAIDVLGEVTPKSMDFILSKGELFSSKIVHAFLSKTNNNAFYLDTREVIKTDSNFTNAEVINGCDIHIKQRCEEIFKDYSLIICGGFIASDEKNTTTTLGRGGSDYTAALFARSLNAEKLEIWTDVDGILTSDPRLIKTAKLVKKLSYSEASELAFFGAKVLHPKTIYPAVSNNIPVYVLNTFKPESNGSLIIEKVEKVNFIKAIAFRRNTVVINIHSNRMLGAYGFLSKVFEIFKNHSTPVDIVTTSEVSISLTINEKKNLNNIINDLETFSKVEVFENKVIIAAIGEGIRNTAGIAARFFGALKGINISMVSLGASEVNLSIIISEDNYAEAVNNLHSEFFDNEIDTEIFEELKR